MKWSKELDDALKKYYPYIENEKVVEIMSIPGLSVSAIRNRAVKKKIKKAFRYWDTWEEQYVIQNWGLLSVDEIAEKLHPKTKWSIYAKRRELMKKKSDP